MDGNNPIFSLIFRGGVQLPLISYQGFIAEYFNQLDINPELLSSPLIFNYKKKNCENVNILECQSVRNL